MNMLKIKNINEGDISLLLIIILAQVYFFHHLHPNVSYFF